MSPDRSLMVLREAGPARPLTCWRLDPAGVAARIEPACTLPEFTGWEVLGWAAGDLLALWRGLGRGSEVCIVAVDSDARPPIRHVLVGRPVACRVTGSGRVAVLTAVSRDGRPYLLRYAPTDGLYRPVATRAAFSDLAAWHGETDELVLNLDDENGPAAVVLLCGDEAVPVVWPAGIRPVSATGYGAGRVGATGLDGAGQPVPGVLEVASASMRWFASQTGYSCVDTAPSGRRTLVARWDGVRFGYRALDDSGTPVGEFGPGCAIVTDPCFTADENHALALFQSPVSPPGIVRFDLRGDDVRPVRPPAAHTGGEMRWSHRWVADSAAGRIPEWTFTPSRRGDRGTVLYLHGGPGGRLNQAYDPLIAALVGAGWSVLGMNYPGSSGYGAEYLERARGDWGGPDAEAVERRLRSLRAADSHRPICLYGHSYGGYLALLVAAHAPDLVDTVAVWAAVTDIPTLLDGAVGSQRRWLEREVGALRLDRGELSRRSPASRLAGLCHISLLVGHGAGDERCPVEQSRQLVGRLRACGESHVEYLEDAASGHTPSTWQRWADAVLSHFEKSAASAVLVCGD